MTPQQHVILAALIQKAAKLEVDLQTDRDKAPTALQLVLSKARKQAVDACEQLIYCDPADAKMVTALQNEVRLFMDLVEFSKAIIAESENAETELSQEEREIVGDLVLRPDEEAGED